MKKSLQVFTFGLALSTGLALAQMNPGNSGQMGQQPGQPGTYQNGQPAQPGQPSPMPDASNSSATSSTSTANASTPQVDDQTLQRQIHEQLATNPDLQGVQVSVDQGKVNLTGTVPSKKAKNDAKKLAKAVPGVKKIKEDLTVASTGQAGSAANVGSATGSSGTTTGVSGESPSQGSMSEQPPASANPNNTPSASPSTTPSTPPQANSFMGEQVGSTGIGTNSQPPKGQASTGSDAGQPGSSNSSPNPGAVTSDTGQSGSASSTTGANGESSDQVQKDIQTAFSNEPTLSSSSIQVAATSDTITLSGTAASEKDRAEARRIAQSFAGNRKVVDNISVSGGAGASATPETNANPSSDSNSTTNSTTGTSATPNQNPEQPSTPKK